jgi:hypothetical protein
MKRIITAASLLILSQLALAAGKCELTITREMCPNQPAEAVKKESPDSATSADLCQQAAVKAAQITRKGVTAKKTVKVMFDGQDLGEKTGTEACQ